MGKPRRTPVVTPSSTEIQIKTKKDFICSLIKKKTKEKFLSVNQRNYYDILKDNEITLCSGPAGVGKSHVAIKRQLIYWLTHFHLMIKLLL